MTHTRRAHIGRRVLVVVAVLGLAMLIPGAASAQDLYTTPETPEVAGVIAERPDVGAQVRPAAPPAPDGAALPVTGVDIMMLAGVGVAAIGAGVVLRRARRARVPATIKTTR